MCDFTLAFNCSAVYWDCRSPCLTSAAATAMVGPVAYEREVAYPQAPAALVGTRSALVPSVCTDASDEGFDMIAVPEVELYALTPKA